MNNILSFSGQHRFLSNFWPCAAPGIRLPDEFCGLDDRLWPTVEHAYQASKTCDYNARCPVYAINYLSAEDGKMRRRPTTAYEAKHAGRVLPLRADWERVKLPIMAECLRQKFSDPELRRLLLATGDATLEEGNYWCDYYWGVCNGRGRNELGRLLMQLRAALAHG